MEPGTTYDLLIVGGGINGAGIARDAAGRGLAVALCEQGDFAGATSSASSKLIHGGLRYLEHGELHLVRHALSEREALLAIAPHISHQLRFVLPHVRELRPAWMIRLGLLLYDHLGARSSLPSSQAVDLQTSRYGDALKPELRKGFVYSDGWIDDARLVILNLRSASLHGATLFPRTRFITAHPEHRAWAARLQSTDGRWIDVRARVLVNAAGPWVDFGNTDPAAGAAGQRQPHRRAAPVRRRSRLSAAKRRPPRRIRDSVWVQPHLDRDDRPRGEFAVDADDHQPARGRVPLQGLHALPAKARVAAADGMELRGRARVVQ
jgi:glycerol-3-phosphate dehydrogenase